MQCCKGFDKISLKISGKPCRVRGVYRFPHGYSHLWITFSCGESNPANAGGETQNTTGESEGFPQKCAKSPAQSHSESFRTRRIFPPGIKKNTGNFCRTVFRIFFWSNFVQPLAFFGEIRYTYINDILLDLFDNPVLSGIIPIKCILFQWMVTSYRTYPL